MNKCHQTTPRTHTWRLVDEARTFVFQFREGCVNILNFDCNVMHARPAFREKLADGGFRTQRLQQLDVCIADCQHAHPDALLRHFLGRVNT